MAEVTIIGNGIIGLCTAYFLTKRGLSVEIVDKESEANENCSFGNAGMLVPSHFEPLAAPGVISKGLKWMLDASSPFYIKPRINRDLFNWLWQFYCHANANHVAEHSLLLHQLNHASKQLYATIMAEEKLDFDFREKGLMMLCNTEKALADETALSQRAERLGIELRHLSTTEVNELQGVELNVRGGVLFTGDAQLNPNDFMLKMRAHLALKGVKFSYNMEVTDFSIAGDKVTGIRTGNGENPVKNLVLATGSWSALLARRMQLKMPVQAGKGYSFTIENPNQSLAIPSIFSEAKLAVTPFRNKMRFAGTMEIAGLNSRKNTKRIAAIKNAIPTYWPTFDLPEIRTESVWSGLRPCSPDGIPYIGKGHLKNLFIGTGHAMMGISLGPITGQLIAQLILNENNDFEMKKLSPLRYA